MSDTVLQALSVLRACSMLSLLVVVAHVWAGSCSRCGENRGKANRTGDGRELERASQRKASTSDPNLRHLQKRR